MKHPVIVRPRADNDLRAARDWYEDQQPGLGSAFVKEVAAAVDQLAERPELTAFYYRNFRRTLLHRFPYKLFYQVIDDRIVVFRALHAKQSHGSRLR